MPTNSDHLRGLGLYHGGNAATTTLSAEECEITAPASKQVFPGALVKLKGDADASATMRQVELMEPGDGGVPFGVISSLSYLGEEIKNRKYIDVGKTAKVHVYSNPNAIYSIRLAGGGQLAAADSGQNIDISAYLPVLSTSHGHTYPPLFGIDAATKAATATLPLKLIRSETTPDNNPLDISAEWLVSLNTQLTAGI